ncbi:MAG: biopolymer transporter ExbD [Pyrinomonadaceae bacterium]|nr:biopolymer transporter ExbD [Pyrinomonadaceae bacterium]
MMKPNINVTPLIDVLLVLLIIFMVVSPLKPTGFKTKIPHEPDTDNAQVKDNSHALVVSLGKDSSLKLNGTGEVGTVEESDKLVARLRTVFQERKENKVYSENAALNASLSEDERVEKTVFIKAPKSVDYGRVAKLIDAVKISGANPISLQIDDLEN